MPERSDAYQLPSWPKTLIDRPLWNATMADIHARLAAREELEASFESLKAQGIQASLDYIQVNVAPQIASLQQSISLAQDQIDQIIIGGKAPDSLKFGGQLPAYYATANALSNGLAGKVPNVRTVNGKQLSADITLVKADVGLSNVDNTSDADKPISATQATALAKRTRVDAPQNFSEAEKGQARANIGVGVLAGYRNKIINGDFPVWQRAFSQTSSGYGSDDHWFNQNVGSTKTHSRQTFDVGQTEVPGQPEYFSRTVVASVAGASNVVRKTQKVEGVRTLAGKKATLTVYAKADAATKSMAIELSQDFGTGGAPSAFSTFFTQKVALGVGWARYDFVVDVPAITGKTLGTDRNDCLSVILWLDAGTSFNDRTASLGHQSGTFDIAHVSLVEGDVSKEADPFSARHILQEIQLCQRYYATVSACARGTAQGANWFCDTPFYFPVNMRAQPTVGNTGGTSLNCSAITALPVGSNSGRFEIVSAGQGDFYSLNRMITLDAEF